MSEIEIDGGNYLSVALEIEKRLAGKVFTMVTTHQGGLLNDLAPTVIKSVQLAGSSVHNDGRLKIPLYPRRNIFWDLSCEKVSIDFPEDGVIIIRREISEIRIIYRVILY